METFHGKGCVQCQMRRRGSFRSRRSFCVLCSCCVLLDLFSWSFLGSAIDPTRTTRDFLSADIPVLLARGVCISAGDPHRKTRCERDVLEQTTRILNSQESHFQREKRYHRVWLFSVFIMAVVSLMLPRDKGISAIMKTNNGPGSESGMFTL
jgi:hypothetical protein